MDKRFPSRSLKWNHRNVKMSHCTYIQRRASALSCLNFLTTVPNFVLMHPPKGMEWTKMSQMPLSRKNTFTIFTRIYFFSNSGSPVLVLVFETRIVAVVVPNLRLVGSEEGDSTADLAEGDFASRFRFKVCMPDDGSFFLSFNKPSIGEIFSFETCKIFSLTDVVLLLAAMVELLFLSFPVG